MIEVQEDAPIMGWQSILEYRLKYDREVNPYVRSDNFNASSIGYCMRRQILERRLVPVTNPMDIEALRRFALGNLVENLYLSTYQRAGLALETQHYMVHPDYQVSMKVDLIAAPWVSHVMNGDDDPLFRKAVQAEFTGKLGRGNVGVEVKSAGVFSFKRLENAGPYPHYKAQVGTMALTARDHPELLPPIDRWELVIVKMEDVKELRFRMAQRWMDEAEERLETLARHWEAGTVPECECEGFWFEKCPYRVNGTCCGRKE